MTRPDYVPGDAEDITDHGASPNPDDPGLSEAITNREAFHSAADAAGSGGAVYIPADTFYIGADGPGVTEIGDEAPEGISVYGAGPGASTLGITRHMDKDDQSHVMINYNEDYDHGTVTWRGIRLHGQARDIDGIGTGDTERVARGIENRGGDGHVECINVYFHEWQADAARLRTMSGYFDACTFEYIGIVRRNENGGTGHAIEQIQRPVEVYNSKFKQVSGMAYNIEESDNSGVVENCWMRSIGVASFKLSAYGNLSVRNTYMEGRTDWVDENIDDGEFQGPWGMYRIHSRAGVTLNLDIRDCVIKSNRQESIKLRDPVNLTGDNLAIMGGNQDDGEEGSFVWEDHDGSTVDFGAMSIHDYNGDGFEVRGDAEVDGSIDTLIYDGDRGDLDGVSVNTEDSGGAPLEPNVPTEDEVGADVSASGGDSGTDDGTEEEEDTTDEPSAPVFEDWTPQWTSSQSDWSTTQMASNFGETVLQSDASTAGRHALSLDTLGSVADVEVLGLLRLPENSDESSSWSRLYARGSGSAGSETGYFTAFRTISTGFEFNIANYDGGSSSVLASTEFDSFVGDWHWVRFRVVGQDIQAKFWQYGTDEPDAWDLDVSDSSPADAGWVGVGGYSADVQQWDYLRIAVDGASAQVPGVDSAPAALWESPAEGTTVSGDVPLRIDATDSEDSDDTLVVEYRVDDSAYQAATYNADTGYYEASWDSTTVSNGEHTLEASVTDSAGRTSNATTTVTTDNTSGTPTVESVSLSEVETESSDAEFDVSWAVSHPDGDLDSVDVVLFEDSDGAQEDETSVSVSGADASDSSRLVASGDDGSGNSYTVELTVTDTDGNVASGGASVTEKEETSAGTPPKINRFSVSESGRPDPDAEVTAVWDVTDTDGDLASVDIEVSDSTGVVQGVTWMLAGGAASDTDAFKITDGDGKSFDVALTVTDETGESTSETRSVTA